MLSRFRISSYKTIVILVNGFFTSSYQSTTTGPTDLQHLKNHSKCTSNFLFLPGETLLQKYCEQCKFKRIYGYELIVWLIFQWIRLVNTLPLYQWHQHTKKLADTTVSSAHCFRTKQNIYGIMQVTNFFAKTIIVCHWLNTLWGMTNIHADDFLN